MSSGQHRGRACRPSAEQRRLMREWHDYTGWEFMNKATVRSDDPQGFVTFWERNVAWLREVANNADLMLKDYRAKYAP